MSDSTRPGASFAAVTTSDTVDIPKLNGNYPRALFFGTGGTAVIVAPDGTSATFKNITSGAMIPVQARRVNATGIVSAADIVAIY